MVQSVQHAGPAQIDYYGILDAVPAQLVKTALELNVFDMLASEGRACADLAAALHVSPRGLERVLRALEAMRLVANADGRCTLTATGQSLLHGDRWQLVEDLTADPHPFDFVWRGLTEAVRLGYGSVAHPDAFFAAMNQSLDRLHRRPAALAARLLGAGAERRGARILDVGCGSAIWSRAFASVDRTCQVTAQDLPGVLEETRAMVAAAELGACYRYRPGSALDGDLGSGEYDVVLLAHVLHLFSAAEGRALIAAASRALAPGGAVAIVEFLLDEDGQVQPFTAFFALLMLVLSAGGNTWSASELTAWAFDAGLTRVSIQKDPDSRASFVLCGRPEARMAATS